MEQERTENDRGWWRKIGRYLALKNIVAWEGIAVNYREKMCVSLDYCTV